MTLHLHTELVPGCYRCDLSRHEADRYGIANRVLRWLDANRPDGRPEATTETEEDQ